jgi:uncharacterized coiled-coil protein SlyX
MSTTEERLTMVEQSVIKLASNKLDITDLSNILTALNTQLADLQTTVANLIQRVEALEQYKISQIASS